jgi:hypothetical protein
VKGISLCRSVTKSRSWEGLLWWGRYHITPPVGEFLDHPSWDSNGSRNYLGSFDVSILVFLFTYFFPLESRDRLKELLVCKDTGGRSSRNLRNPIAQELLAVSKTEITSGFGPKSSFA